LTDSNYTHLLVIVDRSGSMHGYDHDMRGALNKYFKDQSEAEGTCLVDYVQFDDKYEVVFEDRDVASAEALLRPRGSTSLLDAIGKAVTDFGNKLSKVTEARRPGQVLVVIVTDGGENSSKEWTAEKVRDLIRQQEDSYNWVFTFLGANMDAVQTGAWIGVAAANSMTYAQSKSGMTNSVGSLSSVTTAYRSSGTFAGYDEEDRIAATSDMLVDSTS
jgi:hypothetical protein